ncbi:MAG: ABC transporter permease [Nostocaceae cyanobacterium]|nr:ABC transporter permease [Nostocaceae cyanobacterium]
MGNKIVIYIATFILFITGLLLGYVLSQLVLGFLPLNLLTLLGTISLITIFAIVYYALFWDLRRQQQSQPSPPQTQPSPLQTQPSPPTPQTQQPIADLQPDNRLRNKLISLVAGDAAAAERLVEQAKQEHPGMPDKWYWEKAIADVERDRR